MLKKGQRVEELSKKTGQRPRAGVVIDLHDDGEGALGRRSCVQSFRSSAASSHPRAEDRADLNGLALISDRSCRHR